MNTPDPSQRIDCIYLAIFVSILKYLLKQQLGINFVQEVQVQIMKIGFDARSTHAGKTIRSDGKPHIICKHKNTTTILYLFITIY